jgi:hypothetical protein
MQTEPMRMRFAIIWKYYGRPQFQNTTKEVLYFEIVLFSYQIGDLESIDSSNSGQHEIFGSRFVDSPFEEHDIMTLKRASMRLATSLSQRKRNR